jgi:hypothetical protein
MADAGMVVAPGEPVPELRPGVDGETGAVELDASPGDPLAPGSTGALAEGGGDAYRSGPPPGSGPRSASAVVDVTASTAAAATVAVTIRLIRRRCDVLRVRSSRSTFATSSARSAIA